METHESVTQCQAIMNRRLEVSIASPQARNRAKRANSSNVRSSQRSEDSSNDRSCSYQIIIFALARVRTREIQQLQSKLFLQCVTLACLVLLGFMSVMILSLAYRFPRSWEERMHSFPFISHYVYPKEIGALNDEKPLINDDYLITTDYFYNHMDIRWAKKEIADDLEKVNQHLVLMFQSFSRFCQQNNLLYWIAHGTLIGWSWNQKILPWDLDIDVQTTTHELMTKWKNFNQTEFENRYFIDVNKHINIRQPQVGNFIDLRFIDKESGLFIDVTAVSLNAKSGLAQCKSPHFYRLESLFPIFEVTFENATAWVPNDPKGILFAEYGTAVRNPHYKAKNWIFNFQTAAWEKYVA